MLTLLLQIALILILSRVMGLIFRYLQQPQVVGEMVAGIMLGPSILGAVAPQVWRELFPADSIGLLNAISELGVIFFLFLVGLELDPKLLKKRGHVAAIISQASIAAPLFLGAGLAILLYPKLFAEAPRARLTSAALFMGAAMSVTAFPVLARVLTERNLHKTRIGAIAITAAAINDVTAWCILALVVGIVRASGVGPGLHTGLLALFYVVVMFLLVRPLLRRLQLYYDRQAKLTQTVAAIIFVLILLSAYTTEWIGIHALFGAFLMGAIMPKGSRFVRALSEKLDDYTIVLLLPVFFAYTGLKTQIGLLNSGGLWLDCGLITLVACAGKFGGSTVAARACGLPMREASVIGTLMNTRGLMELVILNIGLEEGVITPVVFAMMVIMAIVTTALTTPILHLIYPQRMFEADKDEEAAKPKSYFKIVVPVSLPQSGTGLARIAGYLIGHEAGRIIAVHLRRPAEHEAYRSGLDAEQPASEDPTLIPLLAQSEAQRTDVDPISMVTRDVAGDIAAIASARRAKLVLMGFHKPVFGATILGGKVHGVLNQTPSDVAIFVDRGMADVKKILVPFMGTPHDRLAMDLAGRIGRHVSAQVTVLHVVAPGHSAAGESERLHAKASVEKMFSDPTQPTPVTFKVIEDYSPVEAVLREAASFDLVVVGIGEEFGLEASRFARRPQRIVSECDRSILIVRKHHSVP